MNRIAAAIERAGNVPIDHHLHTYFSIDVVNGNSFMDYMEAGERVGIVPGFLDHFQAEKLGDPAYPFNKDRVDAYLEAHDRARGSGLPSLLGLEVDYYDPREHDEWNSRTAGFIDDHRHEFDYFVGTVHDVFDATITIPHELEGLLRTRSFEEVRDAYFATLAAGAASGMFDGFAHADVVYRFCGEGGLLPRHESYLYEPRTLACLQALVDNDVAIEVNLRGFDHPWDTTYPSTRILDTFARDHPRALLFPGSDAHAVATFTRFAPRILAFHRGQGI